MENVTISKGSRAAADIAGLLRARNPLLWIVTREEGRVERLLLEAAQAAQYEPRFWDCATGVTAYDGKPFDGSMTEASAVLNTIRDSRNRQMWILRDLVPWLRDPTILRCVRSLARSLPLAPRDQARALILLTPSSEVPPELSGHVQLIEYPLPDRSEIAALLDASIDGLGNPELVAQVRAALNNGAREAAIDAAIGLTEEEARSCYARSLVSTRTIEPATVAAEKRRVIAREKVLEWFDPLPGGLDSVGGLDGLKAWLNQRRSAFGPRARAYGLPAPTGVFLAGVSGCGKSLMAKAIATAWGMPLLRLDLGALRSKWVGESEANIRKALKVTETVAPCVLWLDEVEKALAGATQGAADGGTSADALGAVLTWMQERTGSVFVVATANEIAALPPEFIGRFEDTFFVDLPDLRERVEVLRASLKKYGRTESVNLEEIAAATHDFTGRELAGLIPDALYAAFADNERPITTEDIVTAARATVPLARTSSEKVAALRAWAKGRARPASISAEASAPAVRRLDI